MTTTLHAQSFLEKSVPAKPRSETDSGYSSSDDPSDAGGLNVEQTPSTTSILAEPAPPPAKTWRQIIEPRFWSILTLAGLYASAPLVISVTLTLVAAARLFGPRPKEAPFNGKTAIISGGKMTKSFVLLKQLKAQGCRVVLCETHKYWMVASRFSKCVDRFVTVPVPEKDPEAYLEAMGRVAAEEQADIFVPVTSPVASQYEALVASVLPQGCHSWSLDPNTVEELDDKVIFCQMADELGLSVPRTIRVSCHAEVLAFNEKLRAAGRASPGSKQQRYILKNLQYDSMHRLDLFTLPCAPEDLNAYLSDIVIDEANPWTIQTFIVGQEYSTCVLASKGQLLAYTDNAACLSCFNYRPARSSALREWVATFCEARKLSGIACFDFIVEEDGTPYAIECNPRASSNLSNFYNNPGLGLVLSNPAAVSSTVEPLAGVVETYWLFSEVWSALTKPGLLREGPKRAVALLDALVNKKDAYFDYHDPLPFLAQLYVHLPMLLLRNLYTGNKWAKIDPCIGKLTEENGD